MAKSEDLSGQIFGWLKVIERAPDHVTPSGQKMVRWFCECLLCGKQKAVNAQDLRRGSAKSCGCLKATTGKAERNTKICVVCGRPFCCPPSTRKITCGDECRRIRARERQTGAGRSEETRGRMSKSAAGRDMSELQTIAVEAAKNSPNSGRFVTNVNAIDWHLISPEGKHYYFHSLNFWLRENCWELFGVEPDSRGFHNVRCGLSGAKRAAQGKNYLSLTYKGWRVVP